MIHAIDYVFYFTLVTHIVDYKRKFSESNWSYLQGAMPQDRWNKVHNQRIPVLHIGIDHQCSGSRRHYTSISQRVEYRVDGDEPELGAELANKLCPGRTIAFISCQGEWWAQFDFKGHCTFELAIWSDFYWEKLQGVMFYVQFLFYWLLTSLFWQMMKRVLSWSGYKIWWHLGYFLCHL